MPLSNILRRTRLQAVHCRLIPHPKTPCDAVNDIWAAVERDAEGGLHVGFTLDGDVGALRLPPIAQPIRADGLWKHTCFEAFVRARPGDAYQELNFAPSTAWAAYQFSGYREGMADLDIASPQIETRIDEGIYWLSSAVRGLGNTDIWHVGLSAVIETLEGDISYWALIHPPGKPDFHHSDCFALELGATVRS